MFDKVKEVSWSYVVELFSRLCQLFVKLNHCTMHAYDCIYHYSVPWFIIMNGRIEGFSDRIDNECELFGNLIKAFFRPISEPINDTSVE